MDIQGIHGYTRYTGYTWVYKVYRVYRVYMSMDILLPLYEIVGLFGVSVTWKNNRLLCHFLPGLEASSGNSDSANRPGYEAGFFAEAWNRVPTGQHSSCTRLHSSTSGKSLLSSVGFRKRMTSRCLPACDSCKLRSNRPLWFAWRSDVCFEVLSCFFDHPSIDSTKTMPLHLFGKDVLEGVKGAIAWCRTKCF